MEMLFRDYAPSLMGMCRRYVGNENDAQDVFQDGFVRIIERIGSFDYRGEGSLKAWMMKVMMNEALGFLRKRKNDVFLIDSQNDISSDDDSLRKPEEELVVAIPDEVILEFIMQLPPGCRTVLNMYVFEGMGHDAIAETLNIGKQASIARLYRARKMLTEKVSTYLKHKNDV